MFSFIVKGDVSAPFTVGWFVSFLFDNRQKLYSSHTFNAAKGAKCPSGSRKSDKNQNGMTARDD